MNFAFAVKSKKAAQKVLRGLATGHEKGLEKLSSGPPIGFAGPISTAMGSPVSGVLLDKLNGAITRG